PSGSGPPNDDRRPTRRDAVDRLVAERVRERVLGARYCRPVSALEAAQRPPGLLPERDQLRVLDPPAPGQLLDDQLRVQEHDDLARPELAGEPEGPEQRPVPRDAR